MNLRNAYWEKRNLNLNVLEVEFDDNDTVEDINKLKYNDFEYIVIKVPIGKLDIIHKLEDINFRFLETQFELMNEVQEGRIFKQTHLEILKNTYYKEILHKDELDNLLANLDKYMFETDRISLDPIFNKKISAVRYKNWVMDEFKNKDSRICNLIYNDANIGFFIIKLNEEKADSLLAGLYDKYRNKGLGIATVQNPIEYCVENHNIRKITTRISSNNLKSLKVHVECGYKIIGMKYVLRKININ